MKNGKWGIINIENVVKLDFVYDNLIEHEFDGDKLFKKEGKWGVLDKAYSIKLKNEYDSMNYQDGVYLVQLNKKWGVLDGKFNELIPLEYYGLSMTSDEEGYYVQDKEKNFGYFNKKGEKLIPIEYAFLNKHLYKDYFRYKDEMKSKLFGLMSVDLSVKIPAIYEDVFPFENGYALVVKKGKQGYINKKGVEFFK